MVFPANTRTRNEREKDFAALGRNVSSVRGGLGGQIKDGSSKNRSGT